MPPTICWMPSRSPRRPAGQTLINASRGEVWDNQALLARQQAISHCGW
ncbi:hypothetical protein ACF2JD_12265 [Aeromonas sp. A-5]